MSYLTDTCNEICKKWCPLIDQCPVGRFCQDMEKIRKMIVKISELDQYGNENE